VNPAPVTVRVIFSYLVVFDALAGFLVALALFAVTAALGAPGAAYWAVLVGGTLVFWVPLWLRTRVQFTADELIVVLLLRAHRIPWPSVRSVTFSDAEDHDTGSVTGRRITLWHGGGARLRLVTLPLLFPAAGDRPRRGRGGRAERQRETIRREFAARGYPLPE
jgi:hypothetical protein